MSVIELLKMSADELADPTTKGRRLAARDEMTKSSIVQNLEETLEAKRRQAMSSGEEVWRNRVDSVSQMNTGAPIEVSSSIDLLDPEQSEGSLDSKKRPADSESFDDNDADASTLPRKVARQSSIDSQDSLLDSGTLPKWADEVTTRPPSPPKDKDVKSRPKVVKPPSVLDLIRNSSSERSGPMNLHSSIPAHGRSLDDKLITTLDAMPYPTSKSEDEDVIIPASAMARSGPFYLCTPRMLMNSDAETEISVSFPNMNISKFSFTGITTDRCASIQELFCALNIL